MSSTSSSRAQNAVLFAAGSCWEGVDFPGDMVSSLIIVRLPFPVPDPIERSGTGAVSHPAGLYPRSHYPGYAGKTPARVRTGHPY